MVNANLFSKNHPFNWHRRQFIVVSLIEKLILNVCTCVHTMYI